MSKTKRFIVTERTYPHHKELANAQASKAKLQELNPDKHYRILVVLIKHDENGVKKPKGPTPEEVKAAPGDEHGHIGPFKITLHNFKGTKLTKGII